MYKVYRITNTINDMVYIGITKNSLKRRFTQHCSQGYHLTSSIKKYGKESFVIELIALCSSKEIAARYEIKLISTYKTKTPNGFNISDGGESPCHTEEVKNKISLSSRKPKSLEHVEKIRANAVINGQKRKGVPRPEFSQEWKNNMSTGAMNKVFTSEHKANISKALNNSEKFKNRVIGDNFKINNPSHNPILKERIARAKWKPVYCETLNISFLSSKHAAEYFNIKGSQLNTALFRGSKVKGMKFTKITKEII